MQGIVKAHIDSNGPTNEWNDALSVSGVNFHTG